MLKKVAFLTAAAISGALLAAAPAAASNAGTTVHMSIDLAGSDLTLSCGTTVLTPTGGTATLVFHESTDAQGIFHVTGTGTLNRALRSSVIGRATPRWIAMRCASESQRPSSTRSLRRATRLGGIDGYVVSRFGETLCGYNKVALGAAAGGVEAPRD